jgi:hypothetical protein
MLGRHNPYHSAQEKKRAKATQLLNLLFLHATGQHDLEASQIASIKLFIGKFIPDLKAVEMSGPEGQPLLQSVEVVFKGTDGH